MSMSDTEPTPEPASAPFSGPPLLELRSVDVRIGELQILWSVDIVIPRNGITAVLGSNGSGKSTTLGVMSGIRRARNGNVFFEGEPVTQLNPKRRVALGIAHVLERQHIFADMSVRENLEVGAYSLPDWGMRDERMEHVFTVFPKLKPLLKSHASNLSGGEQAMLVIGRALMHDPKLLLLDEPFLGVAPAVVKEITAHIQALAADGTSIVVVDQNVPRAISLANQCVVLSGGRIAFHGATDQADLVRTITDVYMQPEQASTGAKKESMQISLEQF